MPCIQALPSNTQLRHCSAARPRTALLLRRCAVFPVLTMQLTTAAVQRRTVRHKYAVQRPTLQPHNSRRNDLQRALQRHTTPCNMCCALANAAPRRVVHASAADPCQCVSSLPLSLQRSAYVCKTPKYQAWHAFALLANELAPCEQCAAGCLPAPAPMPVSVPVSVQVNCTCGYRQADRASGQTQSSSTWSVQCTRPSCPAAPSCMPDACTGMNTTWQC